MSERQSQSACPVCQKFGVLVSDSRLVDGYRRRRRTCLSCGHRWSTVEVAFDLYRRLSVMGQQLDAALVSLQAMKRLLQSTTQDQPDEDDDRRAA